jgi:hypothetical protein
MSSNGKVTVSDPNRPKPVQDPALDSFLARLRVKQLDRDAHKAAVDDYLANWQKDKRNLADTKAAEEERRLHSKTYTNAFYDLVTDFYEYGEFELATSFLLLFEFHSFIRLFIHPSIHPYIQFNE